MRFKLLRLCFKGDEILFIKWKEREWRWNLSSPGLTEVVPLLQKRKIKVKAEESGGEFVVQKL